MESIVELRPKPPPIGFRLRLRFRRHTIDETEARKNLIRFMETSSDEQKFLSDSGSEHSLVFPCEVFPPDRVDEKEVEASGIPRSLLSYSPYEPNDLPSTWQYMASQWKGCLYRGGIPVEVKNVFPVCVRHCFLFATDLSGTKKKPPAPTSAPPSRPTSHSFDGTQTASSTSGATSNSAEETVPQEKSSSAASASSGENMKNGNSAEAASTTKGTTSESGGVGVSREEADDDTSIGEQEEQGDTITAGSDQTTAPPQVEDEEKKEESDKVVGEESDGEEIPTTGREEAVDGAGSKPKADLKDASS